MKHSRTINSDPIYWDTFKAIHIPCGEYFRLRDGTGHVEFKTFLLSVPQ